MLLSKVQAAEDDASRIDWDVSVHSIAVRAHQHAAGARRTAPAVAPQKGGPSKDEADRTTTAYRYATEAVELLAGLAPTLADAIRERRRHS